MTFAIKSTKSFFRSSAGQDALLTAKLQPAPADLAAQYVGGGKVELMERDISGKWHPLKVENAANDVATSPIPVLSTNHHVWKWNWS